MPRVSRKQVPKNKARIENVSEQLFREHGFAAVKIADVMAAAGLTVGAFYGHFKSKEELETIACSKAFETSVEDWKALKGESDEAAGLKSLLLEYFDASNRGQTGPQCAAAAFAGDIARENDESAVRPAYANGIEALVGALELLMASEDGDRRKDALFAISAMIGGLTVARATRGFKIADDIVEAVKEGLSSQ